MANSSLVADSSVAESTKSILVVDDHDGARAVILTAIRNFTTFRVCGEASNGAEAVEKARKLRPDLSVMDARMPRMSGVEAAMVLKSDMPKVLIVLYTMYADELHTSLLSFGVTVVVPKSEGVAGLLKNLRDLLRTED